MTVCTADLETVTADPLQRSVNTMDPFHFGFGYSKFKTNVLNKEQTLKEQMTSTRKTQTQGHIPGFS